MYDNAPVMELVYILALEARFCKFESCQVYHVGSSSMVRTSVCGTEYGSSILLCHPIMDCSSMVEHRTVNAAVLGSTPSDPAIFSCRLMVGRKPLKLVMVVRPHPREPKKYLTN